MRINLRTKLFFISLLLLLIPFAGLKISDIIKQELLVSREETLLFAARAVSSAISGRTGLFDREIFHSLEGENDIYLHNLKNPIRLNGKTDDWEELLEEADTLRPENLLFHSRDYTPESLQVSYLSGVRGDYLYALFTVIDDSVVYRKENSLRLDRSDHLLIHVESPDGRTNSYLLTTIKPGWVNGFLLPGGESEAIYGIPEPKIQGVWQEVDQGYLLEFRMPRSMVGSKLAFAVADIDDPRNREKVYVIGTTKNQEGGKLGRLLSFSEDIAKLLKELDRPNSRVLIVDSNSRIRAIYGELRDDLKKELDEDNLLTGMSNVIYSMLSPIYRIFTTPFATSVDPSPAQLSKLDLAGVAEAFENRATITRYHPEGKMVEIMAAITPLKNGENIVGAVVVEQTTNSILSLQNRVIEESIVLTIGIFSMVGLALLFFASTLSTRIRRLGKEAASAIFTGGKITTTISGQNINDELGDLSRSLHKMLKQIENQSAFREKMADNLEHEMRTPLAGISASLKNMAGELENPPPRITEYLEWALVDVNRLESLLTAIRDAASLQEMLEQDHKEEFDLASAISMWLSHSWQPAFKEVEFIYIKPEEPVLFDADPGRIHQLLDKLIENAVSFHTPKTPVSIALQQKSGKTVVEISNHGPAIPYEMQDQIFQSMVSQREKKDSSPHLGLGLYIVRTITEHMSGTVSVVSNESTLLTTFTIRL
jgi:two-component system sensor histidine kinase ChvG